MIKIDLITGFLGSGKTTFIREYARFLVSSGERIAIIENDYGAVNIDMVLLQDLLGDNCNLEMIVGGDGRQAHARRFRTKLISMAMSGYTRVIIEPSGIYDADEFFDVLYDEPLDRWYEIGSVIGIVDTESYMYLEGMQRYLFMSEIAWAGRLFLSKLEEEKDVSGIVDFINDTMKTYDCSARFDTSKDIIAKPVTELTSADLTALRDAGYRRPSYKKLVVDDGEFNPLFYFDVRMKKKELEEISARLFREKNAGRVIRIKGFVGIEDGSQLEINATEKEIFTRPVTSSRNVMIVIGEHLDKAYINNIMKKYCEVVSL
jgi:G3E family GTPase